MTFLLQFPASAQHGISSHEHEHRVHRPSELPLQLPPEDLRLRRASSDVQMLPTAGGALQVEVLRYRALLGQPRLRHRPGTNTIKQILP